MATVTHTYPLTPPAKPVPRFTRWTQQSAVGASNSVFTFHRWVNKHQGARWACEVEYPPMTQAQAGEWIGFLLKLQGTFGTFNFLDHDFLMPRGSMSGSPLVAGASQTGNSVDLDALPVSTSGLLLPGDPIGFAGYPYMHRVVDSLDSDGGGLGTVVFEPQLKSSPADNAAVIYQNVTSKMQLADPNASWDSDALQVFGLTLQLLEAIEE